jgi:hypothetical protein
MEQHMIDHTPTECTAFITNKIQSGSAFATRTSDGAGVFIPPTVTEGVHFTLGDVMWVKVVPNPSDKGGNLPLLAVRLELPVDAEQKAKAEKPSALYDTILGILNDDDWEDRMWSVDEMIADAMLLEPTKELRSSVSSILQNMTISGQCSKITATIGSAVRTWYTTEPFRP